MREIGEFKEEEKANAFSAFLHAEGIDNQAEGDDGIWTVWVQDEESLDRATRELERFRENPHRSEYLKAETLHYGVRCRCRGGDDYLEARLA